MSNIEVHEVQYSSEAVELAEALRINAKKVGMITGHMISELLIYQPERLAEILMEANLGAVVEQ